MAAHLRDSATCRRILKTPNAYLGAGVCAHWPRRWTAIICNNKSGVRGPVHLDTLAIAPAVTGTILGAIFGFSLWRYDKIRERAETVGGKSSAQALKLGVVLSATFLMLALAGLMLVPQYDKCSSAKSIARSPRLFWILNASDCTTISGIQQRSTRISPHGKRIYARSRASKAIFTTNGTRKAQNGGTLIDGGTHERGGDVSGQGPPPPPRSKQPS